MQIGTGLTPSVQLKVPLLSKFAEFKSICHDYGLVANACDGDPEGDSHRGVWEVSGSERLGSSEVDQVNMVIEGCRSLIDLEIQLEAAERERPGLGNSEYPGFSATTCPARMPDLSLHHNIMADVLRADPGIYDRLRSLKTENGVTLAKCIKTGIDNQGHPMIKTVGLVAGCAQCYDVFREIFDPVVQKKHPGLNIAEACHSTDMDHNKIVSQAMEAAGHHILAVRVRLSRNMRIFRLPPACTREERRAVEKIVVEALNQLGGELKGDYFPIRGSQSHSAKPTGMSLEDEESLRAENLVFTEPDSEVQLSSGFGRHWPDARGVWVADNRKAVVRVNEDDHVRIVCMQTGQCIKEAFERVAALHCAIEEAAERCGGGFAKSSRLGHLSVCPSNVGTCLIASATVRIPCLCGLPEFRALCKKLSVVARTGAGLGYAKTEGVVDISNAERLGSSEVEQVNTVIVGCHMILEMEKRIEAGETIDWDSELNSELLCARTPSATVASMADFAGIPGLGSEEYPGFPTTETPEAMPDLSRHSSLMADVFKADCSIYRRLRERTTGSGVTLAKCIKPGVDNIGHPMLKMIGVVFGDAECYETFAEIFDPVIKALHQDSKFAEAGHRSNLDHSKVSDVTIDPSGPHAVSASIRGQRNFVGVRMLPSCSREERRKIEQMSCEALQELAGECKGTYFPLQGSLSCASKPHGMSDEELERLEMMNVLFHEPDSTLALSTGVGRDWPEARGVFLSDIGTLAVRINEEDHLHLMTMAHGGDLKAAFTRFCQVEASLSDRLQKGGSGFAWSNRLGYLSSCPSNLGTSLRVEVTCKLTLLSQQPGFKALCRRLRLQVRGSAKHGNDFLDVLNIERLGSSEVEQVNTVIDGCRELIDLEMRLEQGGEVDLTAVQVV